MGRTRIRSTAGVLASALALTAGGAGAARGEGPLQITHWPTLDGPARVGAVLQATGAQWTGPKKTDVSWHWLRCSSVAQCAVIDGADASSYQLQPADAGAFVLAWLRISAGKKFADALTPPLAPVAPAPGGKPPPPPPPPPPAPPPPAPAPQPAPAAPTPGFGAAVPVPATAPRSAPRARALRPKPTVRIRGWLTQGGAHLTLLSVRAPRGVSIAVRCRGGDCPARRSVVARTSRRDTRLRGFERILPAGTRLEIRVTKRGYIGKLTVITIRQGRAPTRLDRCVSAADGRTVGCPAR